MCRRCIWLIPLLVTLGLAVGAGRAATVKINFQTADAAVPEGYLPDSGQTYGDRGNGFTYGWSRDTSADARERNQHADQRYDTLVHMQKSGAEDATWEIELPNGECDLFIVCGDAGYTDQFNGLDVEGVRVAAPEQARSFDEFTVTVVVADSRLSIKPGPDADNAKICFVDITYFPPQLTAASPNPADGDRDVARDIVLGWTPGIYAATHNVYFGTSFDDVNSASESSPLGVLVGRNQGATTFDPAGLLDFGQTYYWRVDEVNAPLSPGLYKGDVWSFTVEPDLYVIEDVVATASIPTATGAGEPEKAVDGSGLDPNGLHSIDEEAMWRGVSTPGEPAWIQADFDRVYRIYQLQVWNYNTFHEQFLGFGLKDITIEYATEPNQWTMLGDFELARAPSDSAYAGQTLDLGGIMARSIRIVINSSQGGGLQYGLSEIQFRHRPVFARLPQPADGATEVSRAAMLDWRAGREAAFHQVHFSTNRSAVADGAAVVDTVPESRYDPGPLDLGTSYYWKVDEVNDAGSPSIWNGDIWSFTTQEYIIIDDFESYSNDQGNRIFDVWLDGYNINDNGALVGHENPPYAEKTIARDRQSMPFYYHNTDGVANSEAVLTLALPQDWTADGADTLSLYYRGDPTSFHAVSDSHIIMNGTGADIWNTRDQFRFVYKQLTGNGSIIARVDRVDDTHEWAKAGVMIRETLSPYSRLVDGVITPSLRVCMQWRTGTATNMSNPDAASNMPAGSIMLPHWVKLTRTGTMFRVQHSADGKTWIDLAPEPPTDPTFTRVTMPSTVYIGLAVCSHADTAVTGAEFSEVATTGNVTGQWQSASIGGTQPGGNGIDTFYVTIEDSVGNKKTVRHPSIGAVSAGTWTQWEIPLSHVTAAGVNSSSVEKLYLGVGDKAQPSRDASGILYIDDIGYGHQVPAE